MNKKKITIIIVICIGFLPILAFGVAMIVSAFTKSPSESVNSKMAKYCNKDDNYIQLKGLIKSFEIDDKDGYYLTIDNICKKNDDSIAYPSDYSYTYQLISNNNVLVWELLNPEEGLNVSFTCIRTIIPNSININWIVQLETRGEEILAYEDGKQSLIDYFDNYSF